MIRVTMQLFPYGIREGPVLCSLYIVNDGTSNSANVGNYRWHIYGRDGRTIKTGTLTGWRRLSKSPGQLLAAVMKEAYQ